jgi:cell fate regulator YaaT (PSP1 superfamily)
MACKSCSTGSCGSKASTGEVSGCQSNGGCGSGGCNKMNVFDWLSDLDVPQFQRFHVVEVKFKGGRKEYFRNSNKLELHTGDAVMIESTTGVHVGIVSLQGELVRLQLLKKSIKDDDNLKSIVRIATDKDLEKHEQMIARDMPSMYRGRQIISELKLNMKLSDVEFQSDGTKAVFYYSSEDRVDFRELIKLLATEFKVRVEMKQISLRQEAGRLGGIGVCGRELCCSTWLTDFKNVTTSAARYQNLSLNPVKLSGQCGRLKCCLNYELETYMDALKGIPTIEGRLKTKKGDAILQKTDIFKRMMWFGIVGEEAIWIPVSCDRVAEIIELNKQGIIPESFSDLNPNAPVVEKPTLSELNSDLERMDKKYGGKKPTNKSGNNRNGNRDRFDNRGPRDNRGPKPEGRDNNRPPRPDNRGPKPPIPGKDTVENRGPIPQQDGKLGAEQGPISEGNGPVNNGENTAPKPFKKKFKKKFKPRPPREGGPSDAPAVQ